MARKSKLTPEQWKQARQDREISGATFGELEQRYGIAKSMLARRAKDEQWGEPQDVQAVIRAKVNAKVNGTDTLDPAEKAAAIVAEAERVASIVRLQRSEINLIRSMLLEAAGVDTATRQKTRKPNADEIRAAKMAAETMTKIHEMERTAWGMDNQQHEAEIVIKNPRGWDK